MCRVAASMSQYGTESFAPVLHRSVVASYDQAASVTGNGVPASMPITIAAEPESSMKKRASAWKAGSQPLSGVRHESVSGS